MIVAMAIVVRSLCLYLCNFRQMKRTTKTIETNRSRMDLFDLRNHLINHYRKLSSVSSVVNSGCGRRGKQLAGRGRAVVKTRVTSRPLDAASRSVSKSISSLPSVRRHDCLTPNEKLTTYRTRSETGRNYKTNEPPLTSSTNFQSKNGDNLNYRSRSRSGTATAKSETADEHDYAHFAWLITEDILHNQLFDIEQIEHVFRSHVAANRDRLNFHRMQSQIDNLRRILNISDPKIEQKQACVPSSASDHPRSSSNRNQNIKTQTVVANSKDCRDVAVSCRIDKKSIGVMTSPLPLPQPLPKCDKQVNTSNIPSPVHSPKPSSAAIANAAVPAVQNSSSQTDQPPLLFGSSSLSKSADFPSYQNRSLTVRPPTIPTNGDTFITNWPMMKKYQLRNSAPNRMPTATTIANLDAYCSRKRTSTTTVSSTSSHSARSRVFDPLALSDGEVLLTSISSLTISVTEDDIRSVSSSHSSDLSVS